MKNTTVNKYLVCFVATVVIFCMILLHFKHFDPIKSDKSDIKTEVSIPYRQKKLPEISIGSSATAKFTIYNTGEKPYVIIDVRKSCSCFDIKWDKKPILKNDSTIISVTYHAKDKNSFVQRFTVFSNAIDSPHTFIINGSVLE